MNDIGLDIRGSDDVQGRLDLDDDSCLIRDSVARGKDLRCSCVARPR